jgi:protein involved in polysaccharide export with SLBB domain
LNFVKYNSLKVRLSGRQLLFYFLIVMLLSLNFAGCSDNVRPSSEKQLAQFENAGPVHPTEGMDRLLKSATRKGSYRVMPGEVLELTMPSILRVVTAEEENEIKEIAPYMCRVNQRGTITLPVVGEIEVAGRTLSQIETAVINAYYPKYAVNRPSVYVRLVERVEQLPFTVIGLVNRQGTYPYPSDVQYNIMQAIGMAGGLELDLDPRYAVVYRLQPDGNIVNATFRIENGPGFADALNSHIKPGDIVAVEHTPRTRTNAFLNKVFRVTAGVYLRPDDLWDSD